MTDDIASLQIKAGRLLSERAAQRAAALDQTATTTETTGGVAADFSQLRLKPDHMQRPCWTCPDGVIYLEAFHDLYASAYEFLVAIADPVARPEYIHQYKLKPFSLYAAVATNIETEAIITVLDRLSKNELPKQVRKFIQDCTAKVKALRVYCCSMSPHLPLLVLI
jgi:DNA excision repair protein ERCC-3